jgi:hypothetical protein
MLVDGLKEAGKPSLLDHEGVTTDRTRPDEDFLQRQA